MDNRTIVCQFSCGAASAVATKLVVNNYESSRVRILNAYIKEEDSDNRRFLLDCQDWFQHSIEVVSNEKYNASIDEVWRRFRYIKGPSGAPCSKELKRGLLAKHIGLDDIVCLGFTAEESSRVDSYLDANNGRTVITPLVDKGLTKKDCFGIVERAGIELPGMYQLGFENANCPGCPKGGQNYWQHIRKHFPERFNKTAQLQRILGPGSYFLRFRSGPRKGERMPLWELPDGLGNMQDEPDFSCGAVCELISISL